MNLEKLRDLRIVIIDESEAIREALRLAFAEVEGCYLIGAVAQGDEGLDIVLSERPDIVIMDILPSQRMNIEILRAIRQVDSRAIIVIFTTDDSWETRNACREMGASFYVLKGRLLHLLEFLKLARQMV
jgi:NarL family two-component system response regulator LiaR